MALPAGTLRSNNSFETIIAALIVAVALGFLVFGYFQIWTGRFGSYELQANLPGADGLILSSDVRVSGLKVGAVTGLSVTNPNFRAHVRFRIRDDLFLPVDSSFTVTYPPMGNPYLTIQPGHSRRRALPGSVFGRPDRSVLRSIARNTLPQRSTP